MNSLERVVTALQHKEPDRVPFFNFFTVHGAKILGMDYTDYYSDPENIARAQIMLREKFGHDCLFPFFYAAVEVEAFGGSRDINLHGPPQAGNPPFNDVNALLARELPEPSETLANPLRATELLARECGAEVPILNAIIAPFSLPALLFGMEHWINTIVTAPDRAREVVEFLLPYSISYSNALFEKGATAIAYFNPFASPHIVQFEEYQRLSFDLDKQYFSQIKGPGVFALAGSRAEPLLALIAEVGAAGVVISAQDNLGKIKQDWGDRLNLIGNLNNVAMESWTPSITDEAVRECCESAAQGGGYILADHHGDLPERVSDEVLFQIQASVEQWGKYSAA